MPYDTTVASPTLLSEILGAGLIGDLLPQCYEIGANGWFQIGSVMALNVQGKAVLASDADVDNLIGILVEERTFIDIASERLPTVIIARHGTFKAGMLRVVDGSSLRVMAPKLRELGIYLEGVEAAYYPPFKLRMVNPNNGVAAATNTVITVYLDGSVSNTAAIFFNNVAQQTTFLNSGALRCTIATMPAAGTYKVHVFDQGQASNSINFEVRTP